VAFATSIFPSQRAFVALIVRLIQVVIRWIRAKLWSRLVSGYAMDALGTPQGGVDDDAARAFLEAAASSETTSHEGVGLGRDVVLTSPTTVGHALTWEGGVVHLAIFTTEERNDRGARAGGWSASPRGRRRLQRFHD